MIDFIVGVIKFDKIKTSLFKCKNKANLLNKKIFLYQNNIALKQFINNTQKHCCFLYKRLNELNKLLE